MLPLAGSLDGLSALSAYVVVLYALCLLAAIGAAMVVFAVPTWWRDHRRYRRRGNLPVARLHGRSGAREETSGSRELGRPMTWAELERELDDSR